MLHEMISTLTAEEMTREEHARSISVCLAPESKQHREASHPEQPIDLLPEQPHSPGQEFVNPSAGSDEHSHFGETGAPPCGHSLFQEMFFFCTVKKIGDLPGSGCIYVETVVDRDCGVSFAKIYPAKNPLNAVDILTSQVMPYFKRQGDPVKDIHTRNTSEYCGLPPIHPFEAFLSASRIRHLFMNEMGHPWNYLCEEFYRHLLKHFFPTALRKTFPISLRELQKDLDAFVAAYNESRIRRQIA